MFYCAPSFSQMGVESNVSGLLNKIISFANNMFEIILMSYPIALSACSFNLNTLSGEIFLISIIFKSSSLMIFFKI